MPNNILKDFFYGNINPNEKQFDRNSEYGKAAAGLADEEEKLRSMLDQEADNIRGLNAAFTEFDEMMGRFTENGGRGSAVSARKE